MGAHLTKYMRKQHESDMGIQHVQNWIMFGDHPDFVARDPPWVLLGVTILETQFILEVLNFTIVYFHLFNIILNI